MPFLAALTWNPDPELFRLGPLAIRSYSLLFVAGLLLGHKAWMSQCLRLGYDFKVSDRWLAWAVVAVVAGSRLGHCFFYEPLYYLQHPLEILFVWKGGLASHGATIGILTAIGLYARRYGQSYVSIVDRMGMPVAIGATAVRLGNFMNSEIVGRVTDVPWAMHFPRYADHGAHARHPSQLYEAAMGIAIFLVLYVVDRSMKDEGRRHGLPGGPLLLLYFSGRFTVEYAKEYQTLSPSFPLTMGQILSIPFALGGLVVLILALQGRFGLHHRPVPVAEAPARAGKGRKKKR